MGCLALAAFRCGALSSVFLTEPPEIVGDDYVKEKPATYVPHIVEYA